MVIDVVKPVGNVNNVSEHNPSKPQRAYFLAVAPFQYVTANASFLTEIDKHPSR